MATRNLARAWMHHDYTLPGSLEAWRTYRNLGWALNNALAPRKT